MQGHFQVDIELGNDAMSCLDDIADAMSQVTRKLVAGHAEGSVVDINGNTVGGFGTPTRKSWARVHEQGWMEGRQALVRELEQIVNSGGSSADVCQDLYELVAREGGKVPE